MAAVALEKAAGYLAALLTKAGQRTVDGLQVRPQRMLMVEDPGSEVDLRGAEPKMQEGRRVAPAPAQRSKGLSGDRRVEQEYVAEAMCQRELEAERTVIAHHGSVAALTPACGRRIAQHRQMGPGHAPEPLRRQVALEQPRAAGHVGAHDEERLAGRHQVTQHSECTFATAVHGDALG